ncbi:MAG: response regulator [Planctomycetota bacterium]
MCAEPTSLQRTWSVLLVDDDSAVLESLPPVLAGPQIEVVTAANYPEALEALARQQFDLVITDLRLEGQACRRGLDVVREAKRLQPQAAVVLMTSYGSGEVYGEALRRGAVECWQKSLTMLELLGRIRRLGIPVV